MDIDKDAKNTQWGKDSSLIKNCWVLGKLAIHVQKNEIVPYFISHLTPYTKINSKCNKYLNVSPEMLKLLEGNMVKAFWHSPGQIFGGIWPKNPTKANIEKWDLIKLKTCSTENETTNKVKRQPIEGAKTSVNHMSDKRLIFKIYNELNQLNSKK